MGKEREVARNRKAEWREKGNKPKEECNTLKGLSCHRTELS